jgi:thiosulfate dehydrogenase
MLKGLLAGVLLGIVLVGAGVFLYFASGQAPVAVTAPQMPFERTMAKMALNAYLKKQAHPEPQVPENEASFLEGAKVYKQQCAVCHGLPGEEKSAVAIGMFPTPPQLFHGTGVTDDEAWESYWKIENGIRMTGMPGFKDRLSESQIWQVAVLVKNADKIPASVKAALASNPPAAAVKPATPEMPAHR